MDHSERFYQLLNEMKKTHYLKSKDYGDEEDVLANFRTCEMAGIPAWKGCCVRIGDKFSRIMGFAKKEKLEVKDESIKDTLIDMANYALIALILYEEENNETKKKKYFITIKALNLLSFKIFNRNSINLICAKQLFNHIRRF